MQQLEVEKRCGSCRKYLSLDSFHKNKDGSCGLHSLCKKCRKLLSQTKEAKEANRKACKRYSCTEKGKENGRQRSKKYRLTLVGYLRTVWHNIQARCYDPNHKSYKNYGGRGIENRFKSFEDFFNHVIHDLWVRDIKQIKGLQVDRVDNDGHYKPGNIRFVTHKENNSNKRNSK